MQLFTQVRKANALCNLKTLATSQQTKAALIESAQQATIRRQTYFQSVKIQMDKQGKHILGHRNYEAGNSVFRHSEYESLLKEYAGKGTPVGSKIAQEAGFKEVVDFGEIIGECINNKTNIVVPTTRGTIHYDKKGGAHIVPAPPNPPVNP